MVVSAALQPLTMRGAGANIPGAPLTLEPVEVTGSRIRQIDTETPQPVLRLTEADLEATGFDTLGDAMRALPAVAGQSLVATDAGTGFSPGISAFNLRGLGNNNTLVLIDGRRVAPYASAAWNGFQTVFDFNSVPTAAIASIEVLKDGASAIYGSDAVAGVVNIVLKKNFTGLATEFSAGNTFRTDSNERAASVVAGTQSGRLSLLLAADFAQRASIFGRDLAYTNECNGIPYGGFDQRNPAAPVAGVRGLGDRVRFPSGNAMFPSPQTAPTLAAAVPGIAVYNFQEDAGFLPDTRTLGLYVRASGELTPQLTGFLDVAFRRSIVHSESAPTPYVSTQEQGDSPTGTGVLPVSNPYNPFGQDIVDLRWRMSDLGNRIQDITSDSPRVVAGLEGSLPFGNWRWNGALLSSQNTIEQVSRNMSSDQLVQNAFNGVVLDGVKRYANPFGPSDPAVVDYLRVVNPNHDEFEVRSADVAATGSAGTLPAGEIAVALGAELRTERLENLGTALNRDGQIVGGNQATDTFGDRRVRSVYAEVKVPLLKDRPLAQKLELQLAARSESYSDFGRSTKPKAALFYRPVPELVLRASYGESFLAPNLPYLYTAQSVSFTAGTLADPLRPADPRTQVLQLSGGNPELEPEETSARYAGVVWQPFVRSAGSALRELSLGVEYFRFDQKNLIDRLTAAQILADPAFASLVVRNPVAPGESVGTIRHVLTTWQNLSRGIYEGYDFEVHWRLQRQELGDLRVDLGGTYVANEQFTAATGQYVDWDGEYAYPQFRANGTLAWSRGPVSASVFVQHIGGYRDNFRMTRIAPQWVFTPQVAYRGIFGATVTLGVRNVFDRPPPRDLSDTKLVNENTNFVEPAFWFVRVARQF